MKNVTITMEADVARWARVEAAKREMSLSRFVGEVLRQHMAEDSEYERALSQYLELPVSGGSGGRTLPTRDEVHDRTSLR